MGSTGGPPLTSTSSAYSSLSRTFDAKGVLRFWDSVVTSSLDRFGLDRDGAVNWSKVVFLTTCFVAMAGCGLLSLLRRRGAQPPSDGRRFRRSARKHDRRSSPGAMSSSDEDEYDSNGSLRHGTDSSLTEKDVTAQHREKSVEGSSVSFYLLVRVTNGRSPYY